MRRDGRQNALFANAIKNRRAAGEELALERCQRGAEKFVFRGREVVFGDDIELFPRFDDGGFAVFIEEIDEAGGGNGRTTVFAFEAVFPIDMAVGSAIARGGAIHIDDGDEIAKDNGRWRITSAAAWRVPDHLSVGHVTVAAWPHG